MSEQKRLTPVKAIRAYCIECSGFNMAEVKRCELTDCPLFRYRMGKRGDKPRKGPSNLAIARQKRAFLGTSRQAKGGQHE